MRLAQRYLLLSVFFLILLPCALFLKKEVSDRMAEEYESIYLDRFISKICREGKLTYDEYALFQKALSQHGNRIEINISVYQREQDLDGHNYYSLIVWKELLEVLHEEKQCHFAENSIVKVIVKRWEKTTGRQIQRYGRINKGEMDDT